MNIDLQPPADLDPQMHEIWNAVITDIGGETKIRKSYLPSIYAYCQAVHIHAQATEHIKQYGILVKSPQGAIPNPLIRVQKDAAAAMLKYAYLLGLAPNIKDVSESPTIEREADGDKIQEAYLRLLNPAPKNKTRQGNKPRTSAGSTSRKPRGTTTTVAK